jgi:hypothetical protein
MVMASDGDCPAKYLRLAQPQNPNEAGSFHRFVWNTR